MYRKKDSYLKRGYIIALLSLSLIPPAYSFNYDSSEISLETTIDTVKANSIDFLTHHTDTIILSDTKLNDSDISIKIGSTKLLTDLVAF